MAAWQQASAVLIALIETLLPVEGPEGMLDEADEQRLGMHTTLTLPFRSCRLRRIHRETPVKINFQQLLVFL